MSQAQPCITLQRVMYFHVHSASSALPIFCFRFQLILSSVPRYPHRCHIWSRRHTSRNYYRHNWILDASRYDAGLYVLPSYQCKWKNKSDYRLASKTQVLENGLYHRHEHTYLFPTLTSGKDSSPKNRLHHLRYKNS
jgi:hypothetical protein